MKAGVVSSIRINPRDCQSVLDVLDAAGVRRESLSFAQCVSLALGSLLETARQTNLIPEPDEFQYLNRLSPYLGPQRQKKRTKIANALHDMGGKLRAPVVPGEPQQSAASGWSPVKAAVAPAGGGAPPEAESSPELLAAQGALTRLIQKQDMAENDPTLWTPEDDIAYARAYKIVYPNG